MHCFEVWHVHLQLNNFEQGVIVEVTARMHGQRTWLVKRYELLIFVDDLGNCCHYWGFFPDCLVDNLVTFLNFVVDIDLLVVDSNLAINDRVTVVIGTESLELVLENVNQLSVDPPALSKSFEFVPVGLDKPQTVTDLIHAFALYTRGLGSLGFFDLMGFNLLPISDGLLVCPLS